MRRWGTGVVVVVAAAGVLAGCGEQTSPGGPARPGAPATGAPSADACPQVTEAGRSGRTGNTPAVEALARELVPLGGEPAYADTYGAVLVDVPAGRLALCVTDPAAGHRMAAAAKAARPGLDLTRLDVYRCPYSRHTLDAVTAKLSDADSSPAGFPVYTLGPSADMSGIDVTTTGPGTRSPAFRNYLTSLAGTVPVHITEGPQAQLA